MASTDTIQSQGSTYASVLTFEPDEELKNVLFPSDKFEMSEYLTPNSQINEASPQKRFKSENVFSEVILLL